MDTPTPTSLDPKFRGPLPHMGWGGSIDLVTYAVMGYRFQRRIGPRGLKINLSKNGFSSVSIGRAPFTVNIPVNRAGGVRTTVSIPGTGMSWSEQAPASSRARRTAASRSALQVQNHRVAYEDTAGQIPHLTQASRPEHDMQRDRRILATCIFIGVLPLLTVIGAVLTSEFNVFRCNQQNDPISCSYIAESRITSKPYLAKLAKEEADRQAQQRAWADERAAELAHIAKEQQAAQAAADVEQARINSMNAAGYYEGRRGGCFTYSSTGRKNYVDRGICASFQ